MFARIGGLGSVAALRSQLRHLGLSLPVDEEILAAPESPLAQPLALQLRWPDAAAGNRFVIHPMEGWDGTHEGRPTELTLRRWQNFGRSGAGLMWGCEAVAVQADGRANPNQLVINQDTAPALGELRRALLTAAHPNRPIVGLQLTHSGRWSVNADRSRAPQIAFRHPLLDRRVGIADDAPLLSDEQVALLIRSFAGAARLAQEQGFDFVDIKHCHGYLLHEFLAARTRSGSYGGPSLSQRTRLLRQLVAAVRQAAPRIGIAVRLSVFDLLPHRADGKLADGRPGPGLAEATSLPYLHGFGVDPEDPLRPDMTEPLQLVQTLSELGIRLLNITAGSPYYVPHIQRPAAFPPSDGYAPPEDPLVGVARLLQAARTVKAAAPHMVVVSTGWSYLQDYAPHVAQACLREGWFDAVGLGRMVLSYPEMPRDVLQGRALARKRICRTFSDCTTAPRNGLVSGCYPLDPFYRSRPEYAALQAAKAKAQPT